MSIYFPGREAPFYKPRGRCGKKNCLAKFRLFGLGAMTVAFGGSGDPGDLPDDDPQPGDRIEWKYNNMVTHGTLSGFVVGRLNPRKSSFATVGLADVDGQQVVTVVEVELNLAFELRGLGGRMWVPPDPIRLRLSRVLGPDEFEFVQVEQGRLLPWLPRGLMGWQTDRLSVTGPRGTRLRPGLAQAGTQRVQVEEEESLTDVRGKMIWMAHVPEDPEVPLQCGLYVPGQGGFEIDRNAMPTGAGIEVELLSLRDPRHFWNAFSLSG